MPVLSEVQRLHIVSLAAAGWSHRKIATKIKSSKASVTKVLKKVKVHGTISNLPKGHRQFKLNARNRRWLKLRVKFHRRATLDQLVMAMKKHLGISVSKKTVQRELKKMGFKSRFAVRKPWISPLNRNRRLDFARLHRRRSTQAWSHVIWSDESSFELFGTRNKPRVWRQDGERYNESCIIPAIKHGGGKLMVWGCMSSSRVGPLYRVNGNMNGNQYINMLSTTLVPFASNSFGCNYIFQQDNAPCHVSHKVKEFFEGTDISVLKWPTQSPDLSPIENLWKLIGLKLDSCCPTTLESLWDAIRDIWCNIPPELCKKLVDSVFRRLQACCVALGGQTKY